MCRITSYQQSKSKQSVKLRRSIISTRVGTSEMDSRFCGVVRDHPNACGDKSVIFLYISFRVGSSPRVWGQVLIPVSNNVSAWIIPTRVGTRIYVNENVMTCEDHPHACGDKLLYLYAQAMIIGSSPRVWGQAV